MPSSEIDLVAGERIDVVPGWRKAATCRCPSLQVINRQLLACPECCTVYGVFHQAVLAVGNWNESAHMLLEYAW